MRSPIVRNELVVGTFVALAVVLGIVYVARRTREKGLLDVRRVQFSVPHGSGLESGAPVMMKGIRVGEIDDIELTDDHRVRVTCSITPRFARFISADAKAAVVEPPLLGSTKVELTPGMSQESARQDQVLESFTKGDLFQRIEEIEGRVNGVIAKIDSFMVAANGTIRSVESISQAVEQRRGLVGRLIYDEQLADDTAAVLADVRDIARTVRSGEGALGMAVGDPGFADDLRTTARDVRTVLDAVERGEGSLGRLYKEAKLVEETEGLITDARASLHKLDDLNDKTQQSIVSLQQLLDSTAKTMEKVDGLVGSAGDVTGELTKSLQKINEGQGTIAALLNDDALYRETKSLLKELRESVEDLREQAPINSFIGVVFSAF